MPSAQEAEELSRCALQNVTIPDSNAAIQTDLLLEAVPCGSTSLRDYSACQGLLNAFIMSLRVRRQAVSLVVAGAICRLMASVA